MTGFARRPLALFVCCLFASAQVSHAAERIERALLLTADRPEKNEPFPPSTANLELLALNDRPLKLRTERKFNVLGKKKPQALNMVGISNPVELKKDDKYPTFVIAENIEGRTDEETVATGDVELRKSGTLMYGDKMTYWPLEDEVEAVGQVRVAVPDAVGRLAPPSGLPAAAQPEWEATRRGVRKNLILLDLFAFDRRHEPFYERAVAAQKGKEAAP